MYADLAAGSVPAFSVIAPNQCNDPHGRGNGGAFCAYDPNDNGTQAALNPALMQRGDAAVKRIVTAIKDSPVWKQAQVDTNYGSHGVQSSAPYNHFSLLKSIEGGLGLPCLNHACDSNVSVMMDLFGTAYANPAAHAIPQVPALLRHQ